MLGGESSTANARSLHQDLIVYSEPFNRAQRPLSVMRDRSTAAVYDNITASPMVDCVQGDHL